MHTKISLHFVAKTKSASAVKKGKRRYLEGVASGTRIDGDGERMTDNAIQSFLRQANNGDILLYPDAHGIKATEDIGILTNARVLDNGDWYITVRLYDNNDNVATKNIETANMVWNQINGLPPYTRKRERGFSVEGTIPDGEILDMNPDGSGRVINDIQLDGIVLVPKPAYTDSIAKAVYKALGESAPKNKEHLVLKSGVVGDNFYEKFINLTDVFADRVYSDVSKNKCVNTIDAYCKISDSLIRKEHDFDFKSLNLLKSKVNKNKLFDILSKYNDVLDNVVNVRVEKGITMMSPEESALVQNIKSLLDQLGQITNGKNAVDNFGSNNNTGDNFGSNFLGKQSQEDKLMSGDIKNNEEDDLFTKKSEDEDVQTIVGDNDGDNDGIDDSDEKEVVKSEGDTTADDDHEEKLDNGETSSTSEALAELNKTVKSLAKIVNKINGSPVKKSVKKSVTNSDISVISKDLLSLVTVTKALVKEMQNHKTAINGILDGLGVGKQIINKSKSSGTAYNRRPFGVSRGDPSGVSKSLLLEAFELGKRSAGSDLRAPADFSRNTKHSEVRKGLSSALEQLFR